MKHFVCIGLIVILLLIAVYDILVMVDFYRPRKIEEAPRLAREIGVINENHSPTVAWLRVGPLRIMWKRTPANFSLHVSIIVIACLLAFATWFFVLR